MEKPLTTKAGQGHTLIRHQKYRLTLKARKELPQGLLNSFQLQSVDGVVGQCHRPGALTSQSGELHSTSFWRHCHQLKGRKRKTLG